METGPGLYKKARAARFLVEAARADELATAVDDSESRVQLHHIAGVYRRMAARLDPSTAAAPAVPPSTPEPG